MTKSLWTRLFAAAALAFSAVAAHASPWVHAYYTGWQQAKMPPSLIDFGSITHLVHYSVIPNADGTLDAKTNGLTPANVKSAVAAAHAAGRKILFTVGGYPSQQLFESAMGPAHEAAFIEHLVSFLVENGYDGVDLDMEPMSASDEPLFVRFAADLRSRLDALKERPLLTTTALWTPATFGRAAASFDAINLMTYSLSGPVAGRMTWHNAPLESKGYRFPGGGAPPSVDSLARQFIAAGAPKEKLGIGFSMTPYVWTGVSRPGETWGASAPTAVETSYARIADEYGLVEGDYSNQYYHWDANAQAPYLSVDERGVKKFVSYDNELSARAKAGYIASHGLGGLAVWDLQGGYRESRPEGRRQELMSAIKAALR